MIKLSKVFTRERSLFYMRMWNDSDRMGFSRWLSTDVQNNMFWREGNINKISVWYDREEYDRLGELTAEKLHVDSKLFEKMVRVFHDLWRPIAPYVQNGKLITSADELEKFYQDVVAWWSVMALMFLIPNVPRIPRKQREAALALREKVELFSDAMDHLMVRYVVEELPQYKELAWVMMPEEAIKLGRDELSQYELDKIRGRLHGFALLNEKICSRQELPGALAKQGIQLEQEHTTAGLHEISGTPASAGIARGRVRQILLKEQIHELQKGEILVTEMTNPNYVPAMKKASAIVTDEGGITCHAAIVSRELGKPCVIGTKIATRVLKNGDEVEVDADKGTVKLL